MPDVEDATWPDDCRICREQTPPLLHPCRCSSLVHLPCLRRWVATRAAAAFPLAPYVQPSCEVCLAPYAAAPDTVAAPEPPPHAKHPFSLAAALARFRAPGDPLQLQPRDWSSTCDGFLSLEACALMCLSALAFVAHWIYILGVYGTDVSAPGPSPQMSTAASAFSSVTAAAEEPIVTGRDDQSFHSERLLLAAVNALLILAILVLVQKLVSRCLREMSSGLPNTASPGLSYSSTDATTFVTARQGSSSPSSSNSSAGIVHAVQRSEACHGAGHFLLTVILSVTAGAEVFFLLSAL
jgi:RING-variant domain